jgi:biopolymer transport protein ExbD
MQHNSERAGAKSAPHINVTPLIDVLLVLLIIFMVIAPLKAARFKALVPQEPAPNRNVRANDLTLVVTIDRELRLKLNRSDYLGTVGEPTRLVAELCKALRGREEAGTLRQGLFDPMSLPPSERIEKTVFIKAPRALRYGEVVRVIDEIKGAGANPVGLQIDDLEP